jgi:hypothetical protein
MICACFDPAPVRNSSAVYDGGRDSDSLAASSVSDAALCVRSTPTTHTLTNTTRRHAAAEYVSLDPLLMKYFFSVSILICLGYCVYLFTIRPSVPDIDAPSAGNIIADGDYRIPVSYIDAELVDVQMNPGSLTLLGSNLDFYVTKTKDGIWLYRVKDGKMMANQESTQADLITRYMYEVSLKKDYTRIRNAWFPTYFHLTIKWFQSQFKRI